MLWYRSFTFTEVHAFEMKHSWDKVDKKEANNCTININYVVYIDVNHCYSKTDAYKNNYVDNLWDINFAFMRLL